MRKEGFNILVFSSDATLVDQIVSATDYSDINITHLESLASALVYSENKPVNTAFIDTNLKNFHLLIDELKKAETVCKIILITDATDFHAYFSKFREDVFDFLEHPVTKNKIALSFHRLSKLNSNSTIIKKTETSFTAAEKLSFIHQFVSNISDYIGMIAEHVQGGVKYVNDLPYFISIHSSDLKILHYNETFRKTIGDLKGSSSWKIFSDKYRKKNKCPVALTINSAQPMTEKCHIRYASGESVPVFVHSTPILNIKGKVEFVLLVFAGVKDLDAVSQNFHTMQQDYHQLFNAVPSYIAVLNRNLKITEINKRFKLDFGDHTGRFFFHVLNPGSLPVGEDPVSKVLKDGNSHHGEIVLTSENGKQYNMMIWAAPITTPSGKLTQILTVLADKTETRHLKDNLSSIGLMLGTLSHNIKGSLTGLDAGLYLIDTGFYRNKPARIEEGLDVSKLMVDRIRKMIFNVLYYAKERELNITETNVRKFAGSVSTHVEQRILGGNIIFECDFPEDNILYSFDQDLLRSALINILENAREVCISDLSEKQHKIIFNVFTNKNNLVFEIHDNGSGIDEEEQKKIFSIFSSSKGLKGTGLGLYITNEVIKKHKGTIEVASKPEIGTSFTIKIPDSLKPKTT